MEAAIASGLLKVAGGKLVSLIASEFASMMGVTKDLSDLKDTHADITGCLSGLRDRAIESDPSLRWVTKLRDIAYDISDLVDEVHLESEKQRIISDGDNHAVTKCFCAKPNSFQFRWKVAQKIKAIKLNFSEVVKQRSDANILNNQPVDHHPIRRNRTTVLRNLEESNIPKRDQEKDDVISKLVESTEEKNGLIVSIVGLGGSGKTTLAQHICHDNRIKENFKDGIFWVHVSEEFDRKKLIGKLFAAITKKKSDLEQYMVDEISKELNGKKFLLVLDDAWHDDRDDWLEFLQLVKDGASGRKVLLTTRDQKVADAVESRIIFNLELLSQHESWQFFLKSSGWSEEDLGSECSAVGKELVSKCGGVPIAIKTLGGVLRGKNEISTWSAITKSNLWNVHDIREKVFASLKLSYIYLDDDLKQCFTLCTVLPKGHEIIKDQLIARWIAHGFINPLNEEQPEVIGSDYFDSLVKVGFLELYYEEYYSKRPVFRMHDLIHDLTRHILQDEVAVSVPNNLIINCTRKCRFISLTSSIKRVDKDFLDRVSCLYVSIGDLSFDKAIKKSRSVRSIILDYAAAADKISFPQFVMKFEYLGYLEIRNCSCRELPEAISSCWNLQALHLIYCSALVTLPKSIGKLRKLRILEVEWGDNLECLPQSLGDCRDLQCLQLYSCEKLYEIPSSIGQIKSLRALHIVGSTTLQQLPLESIGDQFGNIQTLNLASCCSLQDLPSTFSPQRLHTLNLSNTKIITLPGWVTSIGTLECIDLENCRELVELPRGIGNLKRLKVLRLKECRELRCMPPGLGQLTHLTTLDLFVVGYGEDAARISEVGNLNIIGGDMRISNLKYVKDPSDAGKACLNRKSNIHSLDLDWSATGMVEELVSSDIGQGLGVLRALEPPSEVKKLVIRGYGGPYLPHWFGEESDSSYLEGKMLKKTGTCNFLCLTELVLVNLQNLEHLRGLLVFPSLKSFWLQEMPNLEELWTTTSGFEIGDEESEAQYCFPALSKLVIIRCPKLMVVPYFPPSLENLRLIESNEQLLSPGCPSSHGLPPSVTESSSSCSPHLAFPHLKTLHLARMTGSSSGWELLQRLNGLENLEIIRCGNLTELPESIRSLTSLRKLWIGKCSTLGGLPEWLGELRSLRELSVLGTPKVAGLPQSTVHLTSLVELRIRDWENLEELPEVIQHLTSLQMLCLGGCGVVTVLPEWIGQLSALQQLWIEDCSALESLPRSIKRLTALQRLTIWGCPGLAERYRGVGSDQDLVSHIPDVEIDD